MDRAIDTILRERSRRRWLLAAALLAPILLLYTLVYFSSAVMLFLSSLGYGGVGDEPPNAFREALTAAGIDVTVARTLRVSLATVVACLFIGLPVGRYLVTASGRMRGIVLMCVLSPLMVTAIGRIFGWIAIFGPGSTIARLMALVMPSSRTGLLYTEAAMVVGLTNLLLPFMVLAIVGARANVDEAALRAASSLGATPFSVFWQIEMPLSLPGIVSGVLIVFSLSISNFVTAALLGGSGNNVVAYEIYLDTLIYFKPERGAALAVLLLVAVGMLTAIAIYVGSRGQSAGVGARS